MKFKKRQKNKYVNISHNHYQKLILFVKLKCIYFKCIIIIICLTALLIQTHKKKFLNPPNKYINSNNFFLTKDDNHLNISFNITSLYYSYSYKYNIVELEYQFAFFDENKNLIIPSDLAYYYNSHIFCILKNKNTYLQSISNIHQDKYFKCIEYLELNNTSEFGIKICKDYSQCISFDLFDYKYLNYNYPEFLNDKKYDPDYLNKQYFSLSKNIINVSESQDNLKKSYISKPINCTKENSIESNNIWYFKNIYNHYFCFCKGKYCQFGKEFDNCKYYFYLSIIDDNKDVYEKTYYLLADFILSGIAPEEAFFVFREMIKQNMPAFYFTPRKDIYQEYFDKNAKIQKIIPLLNNQNRITGNFLEKYLILILRLKAVISGAEYYSKENIFFNINYITFICLGHGVNYFKPFLYQEYYGCKRYNKIVLPCEKIISIAIQYGWERKNIIQLGLPKWDLFYNYSLSINNQLKEKCIFVMFTWRNLRSRKDISPYYFNNIFKLLNDYELRLLLNKNNVTLYASLHHNLLNNQNAFKRISNIKYINQDGIFNCLMKCSLVVSDFSSVIFDIMYRKKPFIIYVPDSEDVNIKNLYDDDYYNTINGLKNDSIYFENKFFRVDETIKKIEFYINNNFELDPKLKTFYEQFNFNNNNNINDFINYLKSLK